MNRDAGVNCQSVNLDFSPAAQGVATPKFFAWWRKLAIALVVFGCGLAQLRAASAQVTPSSVGNAVPSAIIEFSGGSVAAGIGYSWGSGTVTWQGEKHNLSISGLSIVHVGISSYSASGVVYNMNNLTDINGIYTAVSAGVAVAGGASAIAMKNDRGVTIQMTSTHAGLNFSLGPKGVQVTLQQ